MNTGLKMSREEPPFRECSLLTKAAPGSFLLPKQDHKLTPSASRPLSDWQFKLTLGHWICEGTIQERSLFTLLTLKSSYSCFACFASLFSHLVNALFLLKKVQAYSFMLLSLLQGNWVDNTQYFDVAVDVDLCVNHIPYWGFNHFRTMLLMVFVCCV